MVLRKRTCMRLAGLVVSARDAVWAAIRDLPEGFEVIDVTSLAGVPEGTAREHLRRLTAAGILSRTPGRQRPWPYRDAYTLERDVGVEAPRVRRDGSLDQDPTARERLWSAMKALGPFTVRELALGSGVEGNIIKVYCKALRKAGYLSDLGYGKYRLIPSRNTGPRAPVCGRSAVFDPNLGRQVWPTEGTQQ